MKDLVKKINASVVITAVSFAAGLMALICYGVTATDGMSSPAIVYFMLIAAMLCQGAAVTLKLTIGYSRWQDALTLIALVLYLVSMPVFVWAREDQISLILNSMKTAPITASWIMAAVGMVLAGAVQVAASFFKDKAA